MVIHVLHPLTGIVKGWQTDERKTDYMLTTLYSAHHYLEHIIAAVVPHENIFFSVIIHVLFCTMCYYGALEIWEGIWTGDECNDSRSE